MTISDIFENYHITPQFPPAAQRQAQDFPSFVKDEDLKGRLDLTDKLIFTIDGDDAKDFDDAVSLEKNEKGNFVLGVHIADVSHYVKENSPIDRAAYQRGTSVYLINTVVPMLPFELSNGLSSLKPDCIRLTLSVFMEISLSGVLKSYEIYESFIKSKYRMTYNEVSGILGNDKVLCEKYRPLEKTLKEMNKLSKILLKRRVLRGAIEFKERETKIILDKNDKPISVEKYILKDSNSLIEEFMLIANETIAKHLSKKKLPAVFRIHENPSLKKIEQLNKVLNVLGVNKVLRPESSSKDYQDVLNCVKGKEYENIVNYLALRTMQKAEYSEINCGHFGLSASYYCHFTSPIRRYPDLFTHRILKKDIHKKIDDNARIKYNILAQSAAVSSTAAEINSADLEADYKRLKMVEFMENKIGETYFGNISHVTANGFFVELDNTVEGFVAAKSIEDDVYVLSDNMFSIEGITNKKKFMIGDRVKIKVSLADKETGVLDFSLITDSKKRKGTKKASSKQTLKAIKNIKKESRKLREEREEKRFKIDYAIDKAYKKANKDILNPFIEKLSVKNAEKRFLRTSFEDFWHLGIRPFVREFYKADEIDGERLIVSFMVLFENFMYSCYNSLNKKPEDKFIEDKKKVLNKILNAFLREIK